MGCIQGTAREGSSGVLLGLRRLSPITRGALPEPRISPGSRSRAPRDIAPIYISTKPTTIFIFSLFRFWWRAQVGRRCSLLVAPSRPRIVPINSPAPAPLHESFSYHPPDHPQYHPQVSLASITPSITPSFTPSFTPSINPSINPSSRLCGRGRIFGAGRRGHV